MKPDTFIVTVSTRQYAELEVEAWDSRDAAHQAETIVTYDWVREEEKTWTDEWVVEKVEKVDPEQLALFEIPT